MSGPGQLMIRKPVLALVLLVCGWGLFFPVRAETPVDGVSLNFANAEIETVVRAIGKIANRNILVDPRVKGTLNIVTNKPVTSDVAYQILMSALRLQGYAVVEESGVIKVLPEAEAKTHSVPVSKSRNQLRGERLVTHVFHVKNESATQLLQVVKPLISVNNVAAAYANGSVIVVTDYANNVARIADVIDALDVPQGDVVVVSLKYAAAQDLAPVISKLMSEGNTGVQANDPSLRVSVVADNRLNALLIRSESPSRISSVRQLVANLDQPGAAGNVHVVYLKNADATKLAQILRGVVSGETRSTSGNSAAVQAMNAANAQSSANSGGANDSGHGIQADRSTNSLIITAPDAIYNNLRAVIDQLDRRRAQVYVEALIAEVTAENAFEFGLQFQNSNLGTNGAGVFGGSNFSTGGSNLLSLATSPLSAEKGLNLAVAKGFLTLADGTKILNLAMLARFLESQSNTNILSTPNLLMLDNEEAKIVVGQNVPFVTGQYTNTGTSTTAVSPFQTIERKDVGLTLKVKPQIAEGGALVLQIFQESSSVVATSLANTSGPTTNKRSIETTAVVDDGEIIALGGLVQDAYATGADKVPLLGDIPLLGQLFRYDTRQRSKTNLFVFLRPTIIRDEAGYQSLTSGRYQYVIGQQRSLGQVGRPQSPEALAPELPALAPPQPLAPPVPPGAGDNPAPAQ